MIDVNEFKIKNQDQRKTKAFPESELNKLVGKLPEGILDFLKQEGECTFNRDFLWTVLPDQFHDALNEWGLDGNNCFVFMRSSFGSLLYFYQGNFYALNSMRGSINCLNDDIDDVFNLYMCMPLILKTNFWRGLHLDNENNLPKLADDEMYTLVPSIPSGGSPEVSKIEVVKMLPYLVKLAVSYGHQATQ